MSSRYLFDEQSGRTLPVSHLYRFRYCSADLHRGSSVSQLEWTRLVIPDDSQVTVGTPDARVGLLNDIPVKVGLALDVLTGLHYFFHQATLIVRNASENSNE